jgi:hypothetical protein
METKKLFYFLFFIHVSRHLKWINWSVGSKVVIGSLFQPFQWPFSTVTFDMTAGNAQIEQVWKIAVEIQKDFVKIKEACIDFILPGVRTLKVVTVATTKKWNKMDWILKTAGISHRTIKQQWLMFILVLKSKF